MEGAQLRVLRFDLLLFSDSRNGIRIYSISGCHFKVDLAVIMFRCFESSILNSDV